jgi:hypothetical protein
LVAPSFHGEAEVLSETSPGEAIEDERGDLVQEVQSLLPGERGYVFSGQVAEGKVEPSVIFAPVAALAADDDVVT